MKLNPLFDNVMGNVFKELSESFEGLENISIFSLKNDISLLLRKEVVSIFWPSFPFWKLFKNCSKHFI